MKFGSRQKSSSENVAPQMPHSSYDQAKITAASAMPRSSIMSRARRNIICASLRKSPRAYATFVGASSGSTPARSRRP